MGTKVYTSQDSDATITVIGNNHRIELLTFDELTPEARAEFDYVVDFTEQGTPRFFNYRGSWYDVNEFERIGTYRDFTALYQWHGIQTDSFFSGILVRYLTGDDDGFVQVARYSI